VCAEPENRTGKTSVPTKKQAREGEIITIQDKNGKEV
jgi:hypothetical protein